MSIMTSTHGQLVINGKAVRDRDAMLASIAPEFSPSTAYEAGRYVIQSGENSSPEIRKFTSNHAAGTWTDSDNEVATIDDVIADLSDAITQKDVIVPTGTKLEGMAQLVEQIGGGGYPAQKDIIYTMFANFQVNGNTIDDHPIIKTEDYTGFTKNMSATTVPGAVNFHGVSLPAISCNYDSWSYAIQQNNIIADFDQICCDVIAQVPNITNTQTYISFLSSIPFLIYFTNVFYDGRKYIGINFLRGVKNKVTLHNGAVFTNDAYDRVAFPLNDPENAHHIASTYSISTNEVCVYVDGILYMSASHTDVLANGQKIRFTVCSQGNIINIGSLRIRKNCNDIMPPW